MNTGRLIFISKRLEYSDDLQAAVIDGPDRMLKMATALDETVFLPVIALAIKSQYAQEDEFYGECVGLMSERFADQFGDGMIFIKVEPKVILLQKNTPSLSIAWTKTFSNTDIRLY